MLADADIGSIAEFAWSTMTGQTIVRVEEVDPAGEQGSHLTACIQITGEWVGAIVLTCTKTLSLEITAFLFDMPAEEVGTEDLMDAVGEMVNVVAGNLKALLPAPSVLSLPSVTEGTDYRLIIPGTTLSNKVKFLSTGGELISVTVLTKDEAGH